MINPTVQAPELITLNPDTASCYCRSERGIYDRSLDSQRQPCLIYGLTGVWESTIEVQRCSACRYRFVGPDCREIGLFNWNNHVLVTHQLLEDYLNTFSASETPITAYVNVMTRRYQSTGLHPFLSQHRFRSVFFSYARLLQLDGDMICSLCGENPDVLIFDGVSLSFDQKNICASLRPPNKIDPSRSPVREKTVRLRDLQFITDSSLRRNIRKILSGPSLQSTNFSSHNNSGNVNFEEDSVESGSSSEEDVRRNMSRRQAAKAKREQELLQRFKLIPDVVSSLQVVDAALGAVFDRWFGTAAILNRKIAPQVYHDLFIQVGFKFSFAPILPHLLELSDQCGRVGPSDDQSASSRPSPQIY